MGEPGREDRSRLRLLRGRHARGSEELRVRHQAAPKARAASAVGGLRTGATNSTTSATGSPLRLRSSPRSRPFARASTRSMRTRPTRCSQRWRTRPFDTGSRCRASARSSTAARWTSAARRTRRSMISSSTAARWQARWADSRSPCSVRGTSIGRSHSRIRSGSRSSSRTSCATSSRTAHSGRVYLPSSDAESVGCAAELTGPAADVARLVALECGRADRWFVEGLQLLPLLDGRSRACVAAMAGIYRRLLVRIKAEPIAVTRGRMSLPSWEKALVAARSLVGARP